MSFNTIIKKLKRGAPLLAVLIDPDKFNPELIKHANNLKVSCFLVGGSSLKNGDVSTTVKSIKKISRIPVILFPGDETQLTANADGLLLLSLLSGRNPDYLIGKHITAAPIIKKMKLPYLSTAYILIGRGTPSTTEKVTGTHPLDPSEPEQIINTVIAAEQLGFKAVYLEGGSGASSIIPAALIRKIKKETALPLIIGGGINTKNKCSEVIRAGADMVVIGNALEQDINLLKNFSQCF
jgi:phosphoglycerol geranylgeranyltransferase